jgi:hypothetical protein
VTGVGAGKSPARGLGSGYCGLCSGDETAQPRQCATLRDAIDPRENTVCSGGGRGGGFHCGGGNGAGWRARARMGRRPNI